MAGELENNDYTLEDVFSGCVFQIPDYQRYYSWEKEHYKDLWEDLLNILRQKRKGKGEREHYMGTIICKKNGRVERTKGVSDLYKYDIVDGQQRLTSLTLLLRAIFDKYQELEGENDVINQKEERYMEDSKITDKKTKMRLQGEDEEVFRDIIKGRDPRQIQTPSQRRLKNAYNFFRENLEEVGDNGFDSESDFIFELLEAISELQFMVYTIKSEEKATLIFESVNDRGKSLSNLDKTKSFLMHKLYLTLPDKDVGDELADIKSQFRKIYNALQTIEDSDWVTNVNEDTIQRYHFVAYMPKEEIKQHLEEVDSRNKTRKQGATVYLEIIKWWFEKLQDEDDERCVEEIKEYTETLKNFFVSYQELLNLVERTSGPKGLRKKLKKLLVLGRVANMYPLILSASDLYLEEDADKLERMFEVIETVAFRIYAIGNYRSNTGRNKFYKIAYKFYKKEEDIEGTIRSLVEITKRYEDDENFKEDLERDTYSRLSARDIRYLLYFYDKHKQEKNMDTDWDTTLKDVVRNRGEEEYSIDHIWPRDDSKLDLTEEDRDDREECLHNLGNLTIVTGRQNASWKNNPYKKKKGRYKRSNFLITRQILDYSEKDEWNSENIKQRTEDIADFVLGHWNLPEISPLQRQL